MFTSSDPLIPLLGINLREIEIRQVYKYKMFAAVIFILKTGKKAHVEK